MTKAQWQWEQAVQAAGRSVEVTIPWDIWRVLQEEHPDGIRSCGGTAQEFIDRSGELHHIVLRVRESFVAEMLQWCRDIEQRIEGPSESMGEGIGL